MNQKYVRLIYALFGSLILLTLTISFIAMSDWLSRLGYFSSNYEAGVLFILSTLALGWFFVDYKKHSVKQESRDWLQSLTVSMVVSICIFYTAHFVIVAAQFQYMFFEETVFLKIAILSYVPFVIAIIKDIPARRFLIASSGLFFCLSILTFMHLALASRVAALLPQLADQARREFGI